VLDRQLGSGRVPGHQFEAFVPAAKLLDSHGGMLAELVGKSRNQLTDTSAHQYEYVAGRAT
jgi:hypothetical protein